MIDDYEKCYNFYTTDTDIVRKGFSSFVETPFSFYCVWQRWGGYCREFKHPEKNSDSISLAENVLNK